MSSHWEMGLYASNVSTWKWKCWSGMTCGVQYIHPEDELATVAYSLLFREPWVWQLITWQVKR